MTERDDDQARSYAFHIGDQVVQQMLAEVQNRERVADMLLLADELYDGLIAAGIPALHAANFLTGTINHRVLMRVAGEPSYKAD